GDLNLGKVALYQLSYARVSAFVLKAPSQLGKVLRPLRGRRVAQLPSRATHRANARQALYQLSYARGAIAELRPR
ncbi:MAG: hypothetical protein ACODAB_09020, partial [Gemmatimonadota bacterium]